MFRRLKLKTNPTTSASMQPSQLEIRVGCCMAPAVFPEMRTTNFTRHVISFRATISALLA
eukprot:12015803-Karenia_brevis.AAC.1